MSTHPPGRARAGAASWGPRLRSDALGGVSLVAGTVAALVWANWPGSDSYRRAWEAVAAWSGPLGLHLTVRDWIDQTLLLGFFVLIGLEIRREVTTGALGSWRRAGVPVAAALGGMAAPALIYTSVTAGSPGVRGWGVPMATDVAFALGALSLAGARAAPRLRVFLMTLAVADDIGSVVVLVCFYSVDVRAVWLVAAIVLVAAMAAVRRSTTGWSGAQLALGLAAWVALLYAGVEAAVVGVAIGALAPAVIRVPIDPDPHRLSPVPGARRWELRLIPAVNLVALPMFALANAGVALAGSGLATGDALRVFAAVLVARIVGKPVGIVAAKLLSARLLTSGYDDGVAGRGLAGLGATASIGFTIPLLVIRNAFPEGALASGATAGLLAASVAGGVGGTLLLGLHRRTPRVPVHETG